MIATRSSCSSMRAAVAMMSTRQQATTGRAVGSKCRFLTTKTPQKPFSPAPPPKAAPKETVGGNSTHGSGGFDFANPPDVQLEVTPQMKMANIGLAVALCGFVGGVWYYSMSAVGAQSKDGVDPLAQLKMEAQEAMDRQEQEHSPDGRAQQLLQEFTRGDHDPDKAEVDALEELEQMDAQEAGNKKKKAWYKFW